MREKSRKIWTIDQIFKRDWDRRQFFKGSIGTLAAIQVVNLGCGNGSDLGPGVTKERNGAADPLSLARVNISINRKPTFLDVIHKFDINNSAMTTLVSSLMGVVARKSSGDMVMIDSATQIDWATYSSQSYGIPMARVGTVNYLLDKYKKYFTGYVLYDYARNSSSLSSAVTLAGLLDAVAIDVSIENLAVGAGYPMLVDARGMNEQNVYRDNLSSLNPSMVVEFREDEQGFLRDFAPYQKTLLFHEGFSRNAFNQEVFGNLNNGGYVLGWRGTGDFSEEDFFSSASVQNVVPVVCNNMPNLSVFSQMSKEPLTQKQAGRTYQIEDNVHYAAFVMADGDNMEWTYNVFVTDRWWGHRARGTFVINWEVNPSLWNLGHPVLKYFYENATSNDYFIAASSGYGTIFPNQFPELGQYVSDLDYWLGQSGLPIVSCIQTRPDGLNTLSLFNTMANNKGTIYKSWGDWYWRVRGTIMASGKPIKGADYAFWDFSPWNAVSIANDINGKSRSPKTDLNAYSIVVIHPWSTNTMDQAQQCVGLLQSHVRVISVDEMFQHMTTHFG